MVCTFSSNNTTSSISSRHTARQTLSADAHNDLGPLRLEFRAGYEFNDRAELACQWLRQGCCVGKLRRFHVPASPLTIISVLSYYFIMIFVNGADE